MRQSVRVARRHARVIRLAATTGLRHAELCALRWDRDVDWEMAALTVSRSIAAMNGEPLVEISTKNRRIRTVAVDEATLTVLQDQRSMLTGRAAACGTELMPDAYVFSDAADGSEPWNPNMVTRYFDRLRRRAGLEHLRFHDLRKFMETYAQDLGFSPVQVAIARATIRRLPPSTTPASSAR